MQHTSIAEIIETGICQFSDVVNCSACRGFGNPKAFTLEVMTIRNFFPSYEKSKCKTIKIKLKYPHILFLPSCNIYRFYMKKIPNPPALDLKERALNFGKLTVRRKPCGWPGINIPNTITNNTGSFTLAEAQYFIQHIRHFGNTQTKEGNGYFVE